MTNIAGKKIVLGICGSIAAYKSAILVRLLVTQGAMVKVVMTDGAHDFVTPLTLATLSKNDVYHAHFDKATGHWHNHIDIAHSADLLLIAPATANQISKMAHGLCDNLLTAIYLSAKCPVFAAPAMDADMYAHPTTAANLNILMQNGINLIPPTHGELASGIIGAGRMQEPETILEIINSFFTPTHNILKDKKILITAGATREAIDPVRYVSNHSTGKMGYALAEQCVNAGAKVTLVSGHVNIPAPAGVAILTVSGAIEMLHTCEKYFQDIDIAIFAAAVSDFRPINVAKEKIKKTGSELNLILTPNPDIAATFGKIKKDSQLSVGFALETIDEETNAKKKLKEKNFDIIVLNSMKDENATFGYDTNKVTIYHKNGNAVFYQLKYKTDVAKDILSEIEKKLNNKI
ncbi:MAG: bifunctional phosphopantothenoylcysteine decarboxylase/phosphopantothenate--cysteine ligase CoaBC [Cytophagales bacterium]|nr:bifunctional phosphopantothenoylcysteine decarboxylase/phosphopantothenate--cysteine ligase CoaBC [Cytophagales bacterium]